MRVTSGMTLRALETRPASPYRRTRSTLRRIFFHNAGLKVTSLGLSFAVWYSVASLQPRDMTLYNVPLTVVNHRPDTYVSTVAYKVVDLRVRGRLKQLSEISPLGVPIILDVSALGPGPHAVWIDPARIPLPRGVEALRADPVSVPVSIERVITKSVPVEVLSDTEALPPDLILLEVQVVPREVQITGPESKVAPIDSYRAGTVRWSVHAEQQTASHVVPVSVGDLHVVPREVVVRATFGRGRVR
ncbi:MAG: hypothetical protein HY650_14015 [Acidobacteria bacterium]|nr:hypothetical protein [Acidobacteriota bacterium]